MNTDLHTFNFIPVKSQSSKVFNFNEIRIFKREGPLDTMTSPLYMKKQNSREMKDFSQGHIG